MIPRFEPDGQDVMNAEARLKTLRMPSGVSKGDGAAGALEAMRRKVWCRDSTVTISAATVRMALDETRGAAPRYLLHYMSGFVSFGVIA